MANFQPIHLEIAKPAARFTGDPETRRASRDHLLFIFNHNARHNYNYCWGYTIFRTVYTPGSDEAFTKAIERLNIYAKAWVNEDISSKPAINEDSSDALPNNELWDRYYNQVVENRKTLPNASLEEVGRRFDNWIHENLDQDANERPNNGPNSRFYFCVMLDQDIIDNILAMSEKPNSGLYNDPQLNLSTARQCPSSHTLVRNM